jgi:hypothetical protein
MKVGDTISVFAEASAAHGNFLPTPQTVGWTSSPSGIVHLDSTIARDQRVAKGTSVGTATISVTMSGITGQVQITIAP